MKNIVKILLVGSLLVGSLNAAQRTSIKLGTEDWAPFSFKDKKSKKVTGLSTEIINATFDLMNVKVSSNKVMPWSRTQKSGYDGVFDAVYTASMNDERIKYMYFPKESIVSSKWVLFINKKNKSKLKYNDFDSLIGKKICLISGYNYPKFFKKYIEANSKITNTSNEESNIQKLLKNRCDYMPAVLETTMEMVKNKRLLKKLNAYDRIHYFEKPLSITKFYLMFSKKTVSKEFVEKFSKTLKEFKKSDEYKVILNKYL